MVFIIFVFTQSFYLVLFMSVAIYLTSCCFLCSWFHICVYIIVLLFIFVFISVVNVFYSVFFILCFICFHMFYAALFIVCFHLCFEYVLFGALLFQLCLYTLQLYYKLFRFPLFKYVLGIPYFVLSIVLIWLSWYYSPVCFHLFLIKMFWLAFVVCLFVFSEYVLFGILFLLICF